MEDLKLLKAQRTQMKKILGRFLAFIENMNQEGGSLIELRVRGEKMAQMWENFHLVQLKIECLEENTEENDAEREEFEKNYFELIAKTEEILLRCGDSTRLNRENATTSNAEGEKKVKIEKFRLPPIEIPSFAGNYADWLPFYQVFKPFIHDNEELSAIEKFHYLRRSLTGDPSDLIYGLELTAEKYEEAWNIILGKYNHPCLIIRSHVKAIIDAPPVPEDDAASLRAFITNFKKHYRALNELKSDVMNAPDTLVTLLLTKLGPNVEMEWKAENITYFGADVDEFMEFLSSKCDTLEDAERNAVKDQPTTLKRRVRGANTSATFPNVRCPLCKENHIIAKCEAFMNLSPNEKYSKILEKGLCINCLKSGSHLAKNCFFPGCRICNKKHNILVHQRFATSFKKIGQIILCTAKLKIFDSNGRRHYCRALLDSGSHSDFISEKLAGKLNLKRKKLNISVVGIGQKSTPSFERADVKIKSRINNYSVWLKPLVLEKITEDLPLHSFDKNLLKIPKNLALADPDFNISSEIDLLIGSHNFWNCMENKSIQLKGQPRFQATKFGWTVAGGVKKFPRKKNRWS